jgi:hypothetical protein
MLKHLIIFFGLILFSTTAIKAQVSMYDNRDQIEEAERKNALLAIKFEKERIAATYKNADLMFFELVDSVTVFIQDQPVSKTKQVQYLKRLSVFLRNINKYYSDNYLKSGTYLAVLSYYPIMIEWDQKDFLLQNLKLYSSFSIKATRLIPDDNVAEDFLSEYLVEHPDDIFRFADEFDDRPFALTLLEKAVKLAPESAKRYYTTTNTVNDVLQRSNDPFIRRSFDVYRTYGIRSRAYLLLDAITNSRMSIATADSIGNDADYLYRMLVQSSMNYEANVSYSIYRYIDIYAVDAMRSINAEVLTPNPTFESFQRRSPEEMFILLAYGYREITMRTFQTLFAFMEKKSAGKPISKFLITSMNKEKLKDFVVYCDKSQMLGRLMKMADPDRQDYLLALTTIEEKNDMFPPFKTFTQQPQLNNREKDIVELEPMREISKVKPSKQLSTDITDEMKMPVDAKIKNEMAAVPKPVSNEPLPPPAAVEPPVELIKITIDDRAKKIIGLKKNLLQTINTIPTFINEDYAQSILTYAAEKEPDELFKKIEMFKGKFWCIKVLEVAAINAPLSYKRYLYNDQHPVNVILKYSSNPVVKKIAELNPKLGYQSKPLLLLDDIMKGNMTVSQAETMSQDPRRLFSAMVKIISRPDYLGKYSIDHAMSDYSLRFIREINDKIAAGNKEAFESVEDMNSTELYFLMIYGREEVFTSTFNGLFRRFMEKMPDKNGFTMLTSVNFNRFRNFISLCGVNGKLEEFLTTLSGTDKQTVLSRYVANLQDEQDNLTSVVMIAEALSNIKNSETLVTLQGMIKAEYEKMKNISDPIGTSIYGVLVSVIADNAVADGVWYKRVARQFSVAPAGFLPSISLLDKSDECVEQMYFYNDEDGRSSYINFVNTYKTQSNWKIEDKGSYIVISSNGNLEVMIFANKPEYEENGVDAINRYMAEHNLKPTFIVHRGHSFHTEATLERVPNSAKLIFIGSCGGFYKISIALSNAPDAHIISTKQIGTKAINDQIIFALNENIRMGKDISWSDFWDKMNTKLGGSQYFADYVPPHKNLESIFIRAYYKLLGV